MIETIVDESPQTQKLTPESVPMLTAQQKLQQFLKENNIIINVRAMNARCVEGGGLVIDPAILDVTYDNADK